MNILVTGATGVVAGRLLCEILEFTDFHVYCLMRSKNISHARERLSQILKIYDPKGQISSKALTHIIPVLGDVSRPYLGLDKQEYLKMTQQIDIAIHSAASVNLLASYSVIEQVNVGGTQNMMDFCSYNNIPLCYISSYSVLGDKLYDKEVVFTEQDFDIQQTFPQLHYEQSKFFAEKLLRDSSQPWVILRLGNIFGDSHSGCYPLESMTVNGIYYSTIKCVIETRLAPFAEDIFDVTPVDYAAKAILYAALHPQAIGRTWHIMNPDTQYFYQIMNHLVDCGYSLRTLPCKYYFESLAQKKILRNGRPYHSAFASILYEKQHLLDAVVSARIATAETTQFFNAGNIYCPKVDSNLIGTYLNYCIQNGYLPSPENNDANITLIS